MKFTKQLTEVAIAIVILIICFPVAILITVISSSFWMWLEVTFGIEAYGHSGPAEWCYLVSYGLVVSVSVCIWHLKKKYSGD